MRDHRGEPTDSRRARPVMSSCASLVSNIKHVFVLMLENRSFDHMLGFSGITGTDAATGQATSIDGLNGSESNSYNGVTYPVQRGAPDRAPHDPPHGFPGVLEQLCGEGAVYVSGEPYPPINNSGFVSVYARSHPELPDGAMRCFTPDQVPVLTALAQEFVVCDRWFSSMPGPTEPNRLFVHAGTAGFFDEAPTHKEYAEAFSSPWSGIAFEQGTIFDRLREAGLKWRIYGCDSFPNVAMLKGVSRTFDIDDFDEDFASDVASPSYDAAYTFIEPSYDAFSEYEDGNSHHPLGSVKAGELLIKKTYEALRRSPIWESSMLIVTYDEHGGFYDHVAPPAARATGSKGRKYGFTFDQLGPRVPAIIVSPRIPRNLIDHRTYEHSSVVSTLVRLFRSQGAHGAIVAHLGREAPCHARCASGRRSHDAAGSNGWCGRPSSSRRHSKRPWLDNQTSPLRTIRRVWWQRPSRRASPSISRSRRRVSTKRSKLASTPCERTEKRWST